MIEFTKKQLRKVSVSSCCLLVFLVALVWLFYGLVENSKYYKVPAVVTHVTEMTTEYSNMYDINGEKVKMCTVYYTYTLGNRRYTDSFRCYEGFDQTYSVGDELLYYGCQGWSGVFSQYRAETDMTGNVVYPSFFMAVSGIILLFNIVPPRVYAGAYREMPRAGVATAVITLFCVGYTVYTLFIWDNFAMYFAGLAELVQQLKSLFFCFVGLIINIIIWSISVKKYLKIQQPE